MSLDLNAVRAYAGDLGAWIVTTVNQNAKKAGMSLAGPLADRKFLVLDSSGQSEKAIQDLFANTTDRGWCPKVAGRDENQRWLVELVITRLAYRLS